MGKTTKRPTPPPAEGTASERKPGARAVKKATNLTLDPDAVARGERFGQRHGTSLSQLVNGFLHSLPADEGDETLAHLTPPVRRLYGIAADGTTDRDAHRAYLREKYGSRR